LRFWATVITILIADQLTKLWVGLKMTSGQSIALIDGIFSLTYIRNRGAAFGILQGKSWFFLIMATLVVAALIYYNHRYSVKRWGQYSMGLIVGGTIGNMIDRLYFNGAVRDFFSLSWFAVFNVADIAITTGGALVVLYIFLNDISQELKL
jgi:signal peptidase II